MILVVSKCTTHITIEEKLFCAVSLLGTTFAVVLCMINVKTLEYLSLIETKTQGEVGQMVMAWDDATCEAVYIDLLKLNPDHLVKPLWYNYKTQNFRFFNNYKNRKENN